MNPVLIVAGESSGERYGAGLVREFRKLHPEAAFLRHRRHADGRRGRRDPLPDGATLAVMGIFEVLSQIPRIRGIFRRSSGKRRRARPAAAVLIDSPDFNLRLAKRLKKAGSPGPLLRQPHGLGLEAGPAEDRPEARIPDDADLSLRGGDLQGRGHPGCVRRTSPARKGRRRSCSREEFFARHGLDPGKKLVVLLPGSRKRRIKVPRARPRGGRARSVVPFPLSSSSSWPRASKGPIWKKTFPSASAELRIIESDGYDAMAAADIVLSACGTATLEAALLGTPVVAFLQDFAPHLSRRTAVRQDPSLQHRQHPRRQTGRPRTHPEGVHRPKPGPGNDQGPRVGARSGLK